jgi:nitrite reductase (NADH) small subunit
LSTITDPRLDGVDDGVGWHPICRFDHLIPERGVAALIDGIQLAIFRTYDDRVFAIGNIDPFTGSAVLSRGIVGSRGELPTVASPLHKQVFALESGRCLDEPEVTVPRYQIRVVGGTVEAQLP